VAEDERNGPKLWIDCTALFSIWEGEKAAYILSPPVHGIYIIKTWLYTWIFCYLIKCIDKGAIYDEILNFLEVVLMHESKIGDADHLRATINLHSFNAM